MLPPSYHSDSDQSCDDTSSDSSMSFGSSSCDEQAEVNTYLNIRNMKKYNEAEEASNKVDKSEEASNKVGKSEETSNKVGESVIFLDLSH